MSSSHSFVASSTTAPRFINHDVKTVIISFLDIVGADACSVALTNREWYSALATGMEQEWQEFRRGFGLLLVEEELLSEHHYDDDQPACVHDKAATSMALDETTIIATRTINHRSLAVSSLKGVTAGIRDRLCLCPEQEQETRSSDLCSGNELWLVRTDHLKSESKYWHVLRRIIEREKGLRFLTLKFCSEQSNFRLDDKLLAGLTSSLTSLDLIGLAASNNTSPSSSSASSNISLPRAIHDDFLAGCSTLTKINLSSTDALNSIHKIGDNFLEGCTSLVEVDVSGLCSATSIGFGFMIRCSSLVKFTTGSTGFNEVTHIGTGFLWKCQALTNVDLSGLKSVHTIGRCFMKECRDAPAETVKFDRTNPELKNAVESSSRYY